MDFQERHKELCHLSSFINDQEKWLDSVLGKLHWTRENLSLGDASLKQCPYDANHFVSSSSLEAHKIKCWYGSHGVDMDSKDAEMLTYRSNFYSSSNIPCVHIDHATEGALIELASRSDVEKTIPQTSSRSIGLLDAVPPSDHTASLEDVRGTPSELLTQPPHQIISYIKSWHKVPSDFVSLQPHSLDLTQLKGWMFQNLPAKHLYSSSVGGEMVVVETLMKWLSPEVQGTSCLTPDALVDKLTPLLGKRSRSFVLDLWKYIYISRLQSEHGIPDSTVDDIIPLTAATLLHLPVKEEVPKISERVKEMLLMTGAAGTGVGEEPSCPLPMDQVFYKYSPSERRMLYDYAVEVTGGGGGDSSSKLKEWDPDLYRDDAAALKAKLKSQGAPASGEGEDDSINLLEQLKRKRDYRRRRQAYRAKNVHITRRTPREIFRDIISSRMEEMATAATEELESKGKYLDLHEHSPTPTSAAAVAVEYHDKQERESKGKWSNSPDQDGSRPLKDSHSDSDEDCREKTRRRRHHHRSRSRSLSDSRSRSKERHHHRRKHKKHHSRSRSRSRSKDRSSRHKRKDKYHHSWSRSPTTNT